MPEDLTKHNLKLVSEPLNEKKQQKTKKETHERKVCNGCAGQRSEHVNVSHDSFETNASQSNASQMPVKCQF